MKKIIFSVILLSLSYGAEAVPSDLLDFSSTSTYETYSSPALGIDGKVYVILNGHAVWSYDTSSDSLVQDHVFSIQDPIWNIDNQNDNYLSPVIGSDNTVYAWGLKGSYNKRPYFYAIDPVTKDEKWGMSGNEGSLFGYAPAIDMYGNIYVAINDKLHAKNSSGTSLWSVAVTGFELNDIVIDTEVIYVRSREAEGLLDGHNGNSGIIAFRNDGSIKWQMTTGTTSDGRHMAIASDGTIIAAFGSRVYSINPIDGQVNWQYQADGGVFGSPVIDEEDNIFFTATDRLYSIDIHGNSNWSSPYLIPNGERTYSTPSLSASGNIYVATAHLDQYNIGHIYAVNSDTGSEVWRTLDSTLSLHNGVYALSSPLTYGNGRIVIGHGRTGDNMAYVRLYESDPGGLLSPLNSWPMYRGNQQHTAMRNTGIYEKEVVMDDDDSNASAQGGWLVLHGDITVILPLPGGQWEETVDGSDYEGDSFHIANSESESLTFSWSFEATSTGIHSIQANIPVRSDNTIAAVYSLLDSSGAEVCGPVTIDQETSAGTWVEVAECMLVTNQGYTLKLENGDGIVGRKLIADAIKVN